MSTPSDSLAFLRSLWGRGSSPDGRPPAATGAPAVLGDRWSFLGTLEPGRVVLGHDRVLDVPVRLLPLPPADAAARERARQLLRLVHPHLVRVHTLQSHDAVDVLVLDAVDGRTFGELADGAEAIPASRVAALGVELFDGLAWAHAQGVVHGAIDGESVLLTRDGRVVVDGFGLGTPRGGTADDVRAAGTLLVDLLAAGASAQPDTGTTPSPLVRALRSITSGEVVDAQAARDALARARRLGMEVHAGGRPVRPPPWADPARTSPVRPPRAEPPAAVHPEDAAIPLGDEPAESTEVMLVEDEPTSPPAIVLPPPPAPAPAVEAAKVRYEATPPGTAPAPAAPFAPPAVERPRAPAGMAWVPGPAGDFLFDLTPVTNLQYKAWLDATHATPPAHWLGTRVPHGKEQHPVVGVSLHEARAYAAWRGARLPTEREWLAAAGADERTFPWGSAQCGTDSCACSRFGASDTTPVGAHPTSATPQGVVDLLGNVWEWVEGGGADPTHTPVLGGSFKHPCKVPGAPPRTELAPTSSYLYVGFRCAKDAP